MILAYKIINERKKCGWSQEELAEKLNVSRQSVSKWEGAQSVPDIQKIIKMSELFGVTTDYLLKDEMEPDAPGTSGVMSTLSDSPVRTVSMEEASAYLDSEQRSSRRIANAVSLCIVSPVLLILLGGLSEAPYSLLSEGLAAGIGLAVLFLMVAAAVYIFINYGIQKEPFDYLEKEVIETAYGVDGMVRQRRKDMAQRYSNGIAIGVILCVLAAVPLIVAGSLDANDAFLVIMVCALLILVAAGVNLIVRVSIPWVACKKLLQEDDFSAQEKKLSRHMDTVAGIYWCLAVAVYLAWSFITDRWDFTWIVWPIAGVLFAVVMGIVQLAAKDK